jgi:hypothetical protein
MKSIAASITAGISAISISGMNRSCPWRRDPCGTHRGAARVQAINTRHRPALRPTMSWASSNHIADSLPLARIPIPIRAAPYTRGTPAASSSPIIGCPRPTVSTMAKHPTSRFKLPTTTSQRRPDLTALCRASAAIAAAVFSVPKECTNAGTPCGAISRTASVSGERMGRLDMACLTKLGKGRLAPFRVGHSRPLVTRAGRRHPLTGRDESHAHRRDGAAGQCTRAGWLSACRFAH